MVLPCVFLSVSSYRLLVAFKNNCCLFRLTFATYADILPAVYILSWWPSSSPHINAAAIAHWFTKALAMRRPSNIPGPYYFNLFGHWSQFLFPLTYHDSFNCACLGDSETLCHGTITHWSIICWYWTLPSLKDVSVDKRRFPLHIILSFFILMARLTISIQVFLKYSLLVLTPAHQNVKLINAVKLLTVKPSCEHS